VGGEDVGETVRVALGGIDLYDSPRRRQIIWICGWGGGLPESASSSASGGSSGGFGGGGALNSEVVERTAAAVGNAALGTTAEALQLLEQREQSGRALDSYDLARVERAASLAVFSRDIRGAVAILRKCTAALALARTRPASFLLRGVGAGGRSPVAAAQRHHLANAALASPAPLLNLVAMSLAGFPASGVESSAVSADAGEAHAMRGLWKEMCRALLPQLQERHPYLCAACAFLCNSTCVPRAGAALQRSRAIMITTSCFAFLFSSFLLFAYHDRDFESLSFVVPHPAPRPSRPSSPLCIRRTTTPPPPPSIACSSDALSVLGSGRAQSAAHGAARVALVDCIAFGASFLPWSEFVEFTEDCAAQCVSEGGIEGAFSHSRMSSS
jgi:hypothetical protein